MLKMEKACVGYNHRVLIDNISIEINPGEIVTLVGPNGSGKSTILKTIVGQLELLDGVIAVDSLNVNKAREKELAQLVSMVMTERVKTEYMSCREIVAMGRYPYTGMLGTLTDRDYNMVDAAIERVSAKDVAHCDFMKISDGQKQRIMLAKALCQEPKLMVLDEPTSYLDMKYKLSLMGIIRELAAKDNIAIIMSLHEVELAKRVSDKLVCIKDGRIDKIGAPEEVFSDDYIEILYDITEGSYDADLGMLELPRVEGDPGVFVIGGGGSGISTYYRLQRQGIPFAAGILGENDIEYRVAGKLAVSVVSEKAFTLFSEAAYNQAKSLIDRCEGVICTLQEFGEINQMNKSLLQYAENNGKIINID